MALTGDTGNGATLTLALFSGTVAITTALDPIEITPGAITVDPIDVSTLASADFEEFIPGDLAKTAESTVSFKWITTGSKPTLPSAAGTCTITFPLRTGETTAATITGTGFLTNLTPPPLGNGQLQVGSASWKWDGDTGPSITVAS